MSFNKAIVPVLFIAQLVNGAGCGVSQEVDVGQHQGALYLGCKDDKIVLTSHPDEAFRVNQEVNVEADEPSDLQVLVGKDAKELAQYSCDDFMKLRVSTQKLGDSEAANADSVVRFPGEHEYPLFAAAYADDAKREIVLEYKRDLKSLEPEATLQASKSLQMHAKSYKNSNPAGSGEWYVKHSNGFSVSDNWGVDCSPGDSTCGNYNGSFSGSVVPGCFNFCLYYIVKITKPYKYHSVMRNHRFEATWRAWLFQSPKFYSGKCIENCDKVTP